MRIETSNRDKFVKLPEEKDVPATGRRSIKIALLGNKGSGKTKLAQGFQTNSFAEAPSEIEEDSPAEPVFKGARSIGKIILDIEIVEVLSKSDSNPSSSQDGLKEADVVLFCLPVDQKNDVGCLAEWVDQVKAFSTEKKAPLMCLVSTKCDLRQDCEDAQMLSKEELDLASREHSLASTFETSAKEWRAFSVHQALQGAA